MDSIEAKWAMDQLIGTGLVKEKGETVSLTDRGNEHCETIINGLSATDRICLLLYYNDRRLDEVGRDETD